MARIPKVSEADIMTQVEVSEQVGPELHDMGRRALERGFDFLPTEDQALALLRHGQALLEVAHAILSRRAMEYHIPGVEDRIRSEMSANPAGRSE